KYEIVIGDNQSTDGTRELLHEYWEKYPEKVAVILNDQNLGLTTNMYNTMRKCKGKYIIVLYGDDYWISDRKIQEQFD
ncbi:SAM-dependent methyltransferase, partial [Klebsiella oxytoca]